MYIVNVAYAKMILSWHSYHPFASGSTTLYWITTRMADRRLFESQWMITSDIYRIPVWTNHVRYPHSKNISSSRYTSNRAMLDPSAGCTSLAPKFVHWVTCSTHPRLRLSQSWWNMPPVMVSARTVTLKLVKMMIANWSLTILSFIGKASIVRLPGTLQDR
jgi:hypothetical protein